MRFLSGSLLALLLITLMTISAIAGQGEIRLGIEPVDSDLAYFDLTLQPGESAERIVRFANHGEIATSASVFVADVYTLHGGGMGMADIDDPRTGASEWLDFDAAELTLEPGESLEQSFTVRVPDATPPGDYITSIVIQNSEPADIGDNDERFDQTVRQGIAVSIDVPGGREPEMGVGDLRHSVSGGGSVLEIDLENSGNAHLRPSGTVSLLDETGESLADSAVSLGTVYAGTGTVIELSFTDELPPGEYLVSLTLEDEETGATIGADGLELSIDAPDPTPDPEDDDGVIGAVRSPNETISSNPGLSALIAGGIALFGVMIIVAAIVVSRASREERPGEPAPIPKGSPQSESPRQSRSHRQVRQLAPRKKAD